ncbi:unnamed protein product [Calicophoron daubneyi]|uniref:RNA (guanine-9-)-methyltransferase domain-containing protein 1 n=1 Tax=Calicophoron daubneyi TaxID=300641 RepID=A0AAV2T6T7_CALDB
MLRQVQLLVKEYLTIWNCWKIGFKSSRDFRRPFIVCHNTRLSHSKQSLEIPKYLLDRTIPADEVLKNLTPSDKNRLEVIQAEYQLSKDDGKRVPAKLSSKHLLELLCCTSARARDNYYEFLFKLEKKEENELAKKANKIRPQPPDGPPHSSDRITRVIDSWCRKFHDDDRMWAEIRCPDSAQQLIFDFSHESEMRIQDQKNLASQMSYVMRIARSMKPYPFHLVLCGLKPKTNQYTFMEAAFGIPNVRYGSLYDMPWTISPNHYLQDFPQKDSDRPVICLSPNAPRSFKPGEWNHNAVYVVGAIVDKTERHPVTFAQARRGGVECVRLPLERYFNWNPGCSKTLTINCIFGILATAKSTNGDWETALRQNLPKRLIDPDERPRPSVSRLLERI